MKNSPKRKKICFLTVFSTAILSLFATTSTIETQTKNNWESTTIYQLELPKFISSNMVVQRDVPMQFWGCAGDYAHLVRLTTPGLGRVIDLGSAPGCRVCKRQAGQGEAHLLAS